jgi:rod shape-determining protein MreC
MALDTFERSTPPIFRPGLSTTSKMLLLGLLAVLLMAADHRLHISQPLRSAVALVLAPMQWLSLQPGRLIRTSAHYFGNLDEAQDAIALYQSRTIAQAQRLQQVEQLNQENAHLRQLLDLRTQTAGPAKAVQVLYVTADPYTRRVVVDRGQLAGIVRGSAVIDTAGVVGQVTRVYPLTSEVTLLIDRSQSIPVMNTRTGSRHVASGDPFTFGGSLDLKFVPAGADVQKGDLLTTSGIDGVYPAGLHVGRILRVDRQADSTFARVHAVPMASERGRHLLVLLPVQDWPDAAASFGPATGAVGTDNGKASAAAGVGKGVKP